jgi:aminopeptidase N
VRPRPAPRPCLHCVHAHRHAPARPALGLSPVSVPDRDHQPGVPAGARATRVKATLAIKRSGEAGEPLFLNGEHLKLISAAIDGQALSANQYSLDGEGLTIHQVPDAFVLTTEVEIDPSANKALMGLYMSGGRFCTQCEAEGFRTITFFPDRPDVLSRFTVRIEADAAFPYLLSNGNLWEGGELDCRTAATTPSGTTPSPSPPTCSPWWPASWTCWRTASSP